VISYQIEKYADILDEFKLIIPDFVKEVDTYPENPKLNVDHEQIIELDEMGLLQVVTARTDKLVGIHVAMVKADVFYKHILTAFVLFYYLTPECRSGGKGLKMFEFADKSFKDAGAERIFVSRKIYIPNEKMFNKLGYTHIEANYTKAIL